MSDQTIRILLIEDDAGDARFIRQALADATLAYPAAPTFDLTRARRLASGLKRLAPGRFDVVLLDLSLPDGQGLDALVAAQARVPQTPVIVLSDVEDRELALEAMQKGAQDCLFKGELSGNLLARAIRYAIERKRAEEAYQTLVERSLQGLVIVQDFRIVFVNNAFAKIFGYTVEELLSLSAEQALAIIHPEDRALVWRNLQYRLTGKPAPPRYEFRGIRKDGTVCWLEMFASRIEYGGKPAVQAAAVDITERKRAEEMLQRSERFLRDVFEAIQDGISVLDADLNVIQTNRWMEQMYAHQMPLAGRKCYQVYQQRQSPCPWCPSLRTIETGETHVEIVPYPSADNPTGWIELSAFPVKDEQGHVTNVIEYVKDITEQVQAEEALRKSEARYRAVVDSQVDLISRYLPDTTLTFVNDAYCKFYGKTREELIGQSFLSMIVPEFRELVRQETEDLAKNPRPLAGEYLNYRHDGKECWIQWVVQCISDESGRVVELQAVGRDITERKRAEEALRRERDLVRRIMETSPAGIVMVNRGGQITFANTRAEQVLGLTHVEIEKRTYNDPRWRITDYDGNPFPDEELPFRRVMATGQPVFDVRHAVEWPDGRRVLLSINAAPLFDEQGQVDGMVATVEDVTDRVRAEQALREESSFRNTIIKNAAEGLCVCHAIPEYPYVAFTVWNDRMTEITGYTMEEINRLGWYQTMYPDPEVQRRAVERMARMRVGEDLVAEEWTITRADGEKRTLLISTSILETADQEVHVLAVMQDITERKQADAERERLLAQVQEQAQQVREIMDTVPEGVLLLDSDYRVILANPLGKRDLAILANAQVGDTLTRLGDRSLAELLTSPPRGLWHEVTMANRFFHAIARPIEDGPKPRGWVLVIRDMTQQREAERRAQQQERLAAVGQLAAGIAHDFNNIMAVIALYAGMLAQTPDLPAKAYERLQTVKEQAQRATDLIQQILDFSRRAVLERRPMDLLPFLKEQARLLERTLPESIKVELVYGKDEYTVNADPTRMQQAIMNLAVNARDAMPEGGRLRIGLERARFEDAKQTPLPDMPPGEWIAISVSDTGVGIPPEILPHIFEPFFTTKPTGEGTGLGLAQVYGIVSQHEGHIDVRTEVGAGTTFTLYLPALVVPRPEPPALEVERVPQGQGEIILVVEDNAAAREAMVGSLEMLGYRTLQAVNGQEALGVFEQHAGEISLVLSDVVMPEMGGRALLQALRARDPQVRVVMLSGHPLGDELAGLREQGLTGWMLKPLSVEQLAEVVAQALKDK